MVRKFDSLKELIGERDDPKDLRRFEKSVEKSMGKASRKKRGRHIKFDEDWLRHMFERRAKLEKAFWEGVQRVIIHSHKEFL